MHADRCAFRQDLQNKRGWERQWNYRGRGARRTADALLRSSGADETAGATETVGYGVPGKQNKTYESKEPAPAEAGPTRKPTSADMIRGKKEGPSSQPQPLRCRSQSPQRSRSRQRPRLQGG